MQLMFLLRGFLRRWYPSPRRIVHKICFRPIARPQVTAMSVDEDILFALFDFSYQRKSMGGRDTGVRDPVQ